MIVVSPAASVTDQPEQSLWHWQIVQTAGGDRHFCGFRSKDGGGDGRVSSRIVEYDKASKVGITESGRRYRLQGPSSDRALEVLERLATGCGRGAAAWIAALVVIREDGRPDVEQ